MGNNQVTAGLIYVVLGIFLIIPSAYRELTGVISIAIGLAAIALNYGDNNKGGENEKQKKKIR